MKSRDVVDLSNALENDIWKILWAGEPRRGISVNMTYNDLMIICRLIEEKKENKQKDRVEVVRCKDCIKREKDGCCYEFAEGRTEDDDYCSKGERE